MNISQNDLLLMGFTKDEYNYYLLRISTPIQISKFLYGRMVIKIKWMGFFHMPDQRGEWEKYIKRTGGYPNRYYGHVIRCDGPSGKKDKAKGTYGSYWYISIKIPPDGK